MDNVVQNCWEEFEGRWDDSNHNGEEPPSTEIFATVKLIQLVSFSSVQCLFVCLFVCLFYVLCFVFDFSETGKYLRLWILEGLLAHLRKKLIMKCREWSNLFNQVINNSENKGISQRIGVINIKVDSYFAII